jgi:hypothetical protein|tara:strand:- start:1033 stop:1269 length:237 start_codon:yes stop_codon:yes gene_type:complete
LNKARGNIFPPLRTTHIKATSKYAKGHAILLFYNNVKINEMDNDIKELEDNPKLITKFEPLVWLAFIALTAVVGCPVF